MLADLVFFGADEAHLSVNVLVGLRRRHLAVGAFDHSGKVTDNSFVSVAMAVLLGARGAQIGQLERGRKTVINALVLLARPWIAPILANCGRL